MSKVQNHEEVKRVQDNLRKLAKKYDDLIGQFEEDYIDAEELGEKFADDGDTIVDTMRKANLIISLLNEEETK